MAPKKGGKKRGKDEKKPEKIKFKDYDLAKLLRQFKGERTRQENVRRKIAELVPQYVGLTESEHDEFLSGHGKALKKATRKEAADRSAKLQGQLEDFLFYQNPVNRRRRFRPEQPTAVEEDEARKLNRPPMLIGSHGDDPRDDQYVRELLNYYDKNEIGVALSRYRGANAGGDMQQILLEPEHLHRVTPVPRRVPVGLREDSVIQDRERAAWESIRFRVNEEAVEHLRKRWDDVLNETAGVECRTHTERRAAELKHYENTRPCSANILVESDESGQTDVDMFRKNRTASGVFIAALESSHDWLTSYDCLGLVKNCNIPENFETSAVREEDRFYESPNEDEDFDMQFNPLSNETVDERDEEGEASGKPARGSANGSSRAVDPADTGRELRNGKKLSCSPRTKAKRPTEKKGAAQSKGPVPKVRKNVGHGAAPAKGKTKKGSGKPDAKRLTIKAIEDESSKKVRANIDYPYNKLEFCLPKKTRQVSEGRLSPTEWAEATDGRRERHVGMVHRPVSPVNSPPHPPIKPDAAEMSTIPQAGGSMLDQPKLRRCQHGNATCRAWWTHATDECWALDEEPTSLPTNRMEIDAPVMLDVPEGSRKTYHSRLHDHYGRRGHGKARWPRLGIRVPYEPTTLAGPKRDDANASLRGWHSLAMPIVEEGLHKDKKWNLDPDPTNNVSSRNEAGGSDDEDGDDSDDEGDLFRMSYQQGSFPDGRPAPIIPPTVAPGNPAPDDAAPASVDLVGIASVNAGSAGVAPADVVRTENDQTDDAEDL
jgi:hypothetical protein